MLPVVGLALKNDVISDLCPTNRVRCFNLATCSSTLQEMTNEVKWRCKDGMVRQVALMMHERACDLQGAH